MLAPLTTGAPRARVHNGGSISACLVPADPAQLIVDFQQKPRS